ncbi:low specificity L-threonine aldolase [Uliginosibacterium paludis]|uniref:L-threonine aldolase n=1 Tax=Uliginosibacterium paludis TaxID=1615952 RepID=A0ABV2CTC0_9RHOO
MSNTSRPPEKVFSSDNIAGASPAVMDALLAANAGAAIPYGGDELTARVRMRLCEVFERDVGVFLVPTGTAANALSLAAITPPWGAVLCHPASHINNDECGAPEFFMHGARLRLVDGADAKIDPVALDAVAGLKAGDVHSSQNTAVSITQATETGSVHSLDEIGQIGEICRRHALRLHMDGARFANALVSLGCTPAEMTWKAGVDVLSFGATKNGVLGAEAIVCFDRSIETELAFRRKRSGHLFSKMRLLSAQMSAYLEHDLWLANARQANAMARRLGTGLRALAGVEIMGRTEANILFCRLPQALIEGLLAEGFVFYHDRWGPGVVRLVTSWATTEADVDHLLARAQALLQ